MKSLPLFYLPVSIGILVALLLSSCALTDCNDKNAPNLTDAVNGILVELTKQTTLNDDLVELLETTSEDFVAYRTATNDKFDLFQNEIVKIKNDIRNKFPQASETEEEEQTAIAETPFLTLTMEKSEWLLGDTLVFTGTAHPNDLLSITVKLPDRTLLYGQAVPTEIINGSYRIEIVTDFDQPAGFWTVFAKQGKEQSKTLTFKVE